MKIFNTEFSTLGFEKFQKLTKEEQIKTLKNYNPLITVKEIENSLKNVKYGIVKRAKKTVAKSKT